MTITIIKIDNINTYLLILLKIKKMNSEPICCLCNASAEYIVKGYYPAIVCEEHRISDSFIHISKYKCVHNECYEIPLYAYSAHNNPEYCKKHIPSDNYKYFKPKIVKPYPIYKMDECLYNEFLDNRFESEMCCISYYPLGVFYTYDFKYRPTERNVWYETLNHNINHLKILHMSDLNYEDFITYPLNKRIPLYIHKAYVSRSDCYDENDRVCSQMMGFIFINIFAKYREYIFPSNHYNGYYLDNDKYVNSYAGRDDTYKHTKIYNLAINSGIKLAKFTDELQNLNLPVENDISKYIIKPMLTDIDLNEKYENINLYLSENDNTDKFEWICLCEYWNNNTQIYQTHSIPLIYYSYTTVGFPIEFQYKYKTAIVMFVLKSDHTKVFLKTKKIKLLNFKTYGYNQSSKNIDFIK